MPGSNSETPYDVQAELFRPFGSENVVGVVRGRLVAELSGQSRAAGLRWTHILELPADADVRDGVTRPVGENTLVYADGDELRWDGFVYVVVWVEQVAASSAFSRRRAYLLRHAGPT
jgi:hypothetical protein